MANDAQVSFVGTVAFEPKTISTKSGGSFVSLKVSVPTAQKEEGSNYYKTDMYNVSAFGKLGDYLMTKAKPKSKIFVAGSMYFAEPWKNNKGEMQFGVNVSATHARVLNTEKPVNNDEEDLF